MTKKLVNGELVDLTPEEQAEYDLRNAPETIEAKKAEKSERAADRMFGDGASPEMLVMARLLVDLAVAAGVAPNENAARAALRKRWRDYYKQELDKA